MNFENKLVDNQIIDNCCAASTPIIQMNRKKNGPLHQTNLQNFLKRQLLQMHV